MNVLLLVFCIGCVSASINFRAWKALKLHSRHGLYQSLRGGMADGNKSVIVTTNLGSPFLDKKKKFIVLANSTVGELKAQVSEKFSGSPPIELLSLFYDDKLLENEEIIETISIISPINIHLDLLSGTAVYDKPIFSVVQALEGYASTVVQQAFLAAKLRDCSTVEPFPQTTKLSPLYTDIYKAVIDRLNRDYEDAIKNALQAEKNPEILSDDTKAWRKSTPKSLSPLTQRLAKEFDLNARGLQAFVFYSFVLMVSRIS